MSINIIDNFLEPDEFAELQRKLFFPDEYGNLQMEWCALPEVNGHSSDDAETNFQFIHMFYDDNCPQGTRTDYVLPIIRKIPNILSLMRIKANLLTRTKEHVMHGYHVDYINAQGLPHKSAIFYCNNTNGWTQFKNGEKVECIGNRMVIFDGQLEHSSVSQTDDVFRVVINFNYIEEMYNNET
jgi:hypothetical protein